MTEISDQDQDQESNHKNQLDCLKRRFKQNFDDRVYKLCDDQLDCLKIVYKQYIDDPDCVYKLCDDQWLVIMKKITNGKNKITITNESRENVYDPLYAKFRANILDVVVIVSIKTMKTVKYLYHRYVDPNNRNGHPISIMYNVGETVEPDKFDQDLEKVCSSGVHYFKTLDRAYYYRGLPLIYTGRLIEWYDDGCKELEGTYIDGKRHGDWSYWYDNGRINIEEQYDNDVLCGSATGYHRCGGKFWTKEYKDRGMKYKYTIWNSRTNYKVSEGMCSAHVIKDHDTKDGVWTHWDLNGNKTCEEEYFNGMLIEKKYFNGTSIEKNHHI